MALIDPNAAPTGVRRAIASTTQETDPSAPPDLARYQNATSDTRAGMNAAADGIRRAQGVGQTIGAAVAGVGSALKGAVSDSYRDEIATPARQVGAFLSDAYRGATNPGAPSDPAVQAQPSLRPAGAPTAPAAAPTVQNPYGGIAGVAGTTDANGNLTLSNTGPATAENQAFAARAAASGLRPGDLAAGQDYQLNVARRQHELDQDAATARQDLLARQASEAASARDIQAANARMGSGYNIGGGNAGQVSGSTGTGGTAAQVRAAAALEEQRMRNETAQNIAATQAATTLRGQDVAAGAQHYAADTGLAGQQLSANARMAGLAYDRAKFGAEFGLNQDKTFTEQRSAAQDELAKHLGTIFTTTDKDGKVVPDTARIADASAKINEEVGQRIADLQKVPKSSPGYEQAQALVQRLSKKGIAALEPDDLQQLMSQAAIRDRVMQTRGLLPGTATAVESRLGDYSLADREGNLLGSDTLTLRNGSKIRANDLRYTEPANSILPDVGKVPSTEFNAGLRTKGR